MKTIFVASQFFPLKKLLESGHYLNLKVKVLLPKGYVGRFLND